MSGGELSSTSPFPHEFLFPVKCSAAAWAYRSDAPHTRQATPSRCRYKMGPFPSRGPPLAQKRDEDRGSCTTDARRRRRADNGSYITLGTSRAASGESFVPVSVGCKCEACGLPANLRALTNAGPDRMTAVPNKLSGEERLKATITLDALPTTEAMSGPHTAFFYGE